MTESILFDMDGVLFLTDCAHASAYDQTLREFGLPSITFTNYAGRRTDEVFRELLVMNGLAPSAALVGELTKRKRDLAFAALATNPPIAPGCHGILALLAKTYRLGLCSSASRESVRLFLSVSETSHFFSCVLCGEDVHSSKPSPDIFLEAIARMQILACDTAVVEDSISGIRAAKAAGVGLVIAIAREETARKLLHIGADRVVHDLAELPYVLS